MKNERGKVLITGGSGLVGEYLTAEAQKQGHVVLHLSTRQAYKGSGNVRAYHWDPQKEYIEAGALEGVGVIFHLAGATVSKRWTPSYKQEILRSRVQSTRTLIKALREQDHEVTAVISASAVGYYPSSKEKEYREEDEPSHDFLGSVTQHWEKEVCAISEQIDIRTAMLRIGIVLSQKGGVLGQMEPIFKMGLGAPLGCGKQWMSWIHAKDLARLFFFAYQEGLEGPINAGGPQPVTNKQFSRELAHVIKRPFLFGWRGVPGSLLKLMLGEMATLALMSQKVDARKALDAGFRYEYNSLPKALQAIYRS